MNKQKKGGGGVWGGGCQSEHITDKAQESKLLNAEIICKNGLQCSSIQQAIQTENIYVCKHGDKEYDSFNTNLRNTAHFNTASQHCSNMNV